MSFENRQETNSKKNNDLDKGIQCVWWPLDRFRILWLRGEGGLK